MATVKLTNKVIVDSAQWMDVLGKIDLDLPVETLMDIGDVIRRVREIAEDCFRVRQQKLLAMAEVNEAGDLKDDGHGNVVPKEGQSKAQIQKALEAIFEHASDIDVVMLPLEAFKKKKLPNGKAIPAEFFAALHWMIDRTAKAP